MTSRKLKQSKMTMIFAREKFDSNFNDDDAMNKWL